MKKILFLVMSLMSCKGMAVKLEDIINNPEKQEEYKEKISKIDPEFFAQNLFDKGNYSKYKNFKNILKILGMNKYLYLVEKEIEKLYWSEKNKSKKKEEFNNPNNKLYQGKKFDQKYLINLKNRVFGNLYPIPEDPSENEFYGKNDQFKNSNEKLDEGYKEIEKAMHSLKFNIDDLKGDKKIEAKDSGHSCVIQEESKNETEKNFPVNKFVVKLTDQSD